MDYLEAIKNKNPQYFISYPRKEKKERAIEHQPAIPSEPLILLFTPYKSPSSARGPPRLSARDGGGGALPQHSAALYGAPSAAGLQGGLSWQQMGVFTPRSSSARAEVPLEGCSACKVFLFDYKKFLVQLSLSQAAKLLIQYACTLAPCFPPAAGVWISFLRPSRSSYASSQESSAQGSTGAVQTGGRGSSSTKAAAWQARQTPLTSLRLFTAHNNGPTLPLPYRTPIVHSIHIQKKYQRTQLKRC